MTELYNRDILRLTMDMPNTAKPAHFTHEVKKVSRICGSTLIYWLMLDESGTITDFGQKVRACALGQASSALVARYLVGMNAQKFEKINRDFRHMVDTGEAIFDEAYQDFEILAPVYEHKSRKGSVLLPFEILGEVFTPNPPTHRA